MPRPNYRRHEQLVAPARFDRVIWRLLLGLGIVVSVALGLNFLINMAIHLLVPENWQADLITLPEQDGTPLQVLNLLVRFGAFVVGVAVAARIIQNRGLLSVIGPLPHALRQFWQVFRILALLGAVLFVLPPWDMGAPLEQNLNLSHWLALLPVSLFAVLVQISAEEILFRGYIQQSLAARFSNPLIWMVLPSALFALGHYLPAEAGENAMLIALWAGVFGCLMADLTARAGTLGPAIAVHLINNIFALLLVALPGALSGLSLYVFPFGISEVDPVRSWLAVDFATMLVTWLAARLALRR
jgi:membrane protease YdiL (CAAX protease family)